MKEICYSCEKEFGLDDQSCLRCGLSRKYAIEIPDMVESIYSDEKAHDSSVSPRRDEDEAR